MVEVITISDDEHDEHDEQPGHEMNGQDEEMEDEEAAGDANGEADEGEAEVVEVGEEADEGEAEVVEVGEEADEGEAEVVEVEEEADAPGDEVLLKQRSSLSASMSFEGERDWAPWKTSRDIAKEKSDTEKRALALRGVIDGRFVICYQHNKQRLYDKMVRMPGDLERYVCPPDSVCVGAAGNDASGRPATTPNTSDKRYFGNMRNIVQKRRTWRKVCWECGIGEHERTECPNRICPITATPTYNPHRYANDYALSWTVAQHRVGRDDMAESECAVCGAPGSINCCSVPNSTPPCCANCLTVGHTSDECNVNTRTNYHGRPSKGGKGGGGDYSPYSDRSRTPPPGGHYQQQQQPYGRAAGTPSGYHEQGTPSRPLAQPHPRRPPHSLKLALPSRSPASITPATPDMLRSMRNAEVRVQHPRPRPDNRPRMHAPAPAAYEPYSYGRGKGRGAGMATAQGYNTQDQWGTPRRGGRGRGNVQQGRRW
ncbi:hypothetical protein DIPPA_23575 [Diplonema papillatum]|nr:hypothetical protein DIPPA_23575 [Diplonema papillatum]